MDDSTRPVPVVRARSTDPETSQEAAASVTSLKLRHEEVLKLFRAYGPMTDETMIDRYDLFSIRPQSHSGLRTRRSELVHLGKLRFSGRYSFTDSGRRTRVWELAE